jgi:hypothetical protein
MWPYLLGGVAVVGAGYLGYKYVWPAISGASSPLSGVENTVKSALASDPLSVTSALSQAKGYASKAVSGAESVVSGGLHTIEGIF